MGQVRYFYEYTLKGEPVKGQKFYYNIRRDNFITPGIGKKIHDGFVRIQECLEEQLNKRIV